MPLVKKSNQEVIGLFGVFKALCENHHVVFDPKIQRDVSVVTTNKFTCEMTMTIATNLSRLRRAIEVYNEAIELIGKDEPEGPALRKDLLKHEVEVDFLPISKKLLNIGQSQNNISPGIVAELLFLLVE